MNTADLLEQLRGLSNADRLVVIETATRLIRQEWPAESPRHASGEDPVLKVAGCLSGSPPSAEDIESELYGKELP